MAQSTTASTSLNARSCDPPQHDLRHPLVGTLTVTQQTLTTSDASDQALVVVTAEPGTASEPALRLLAQATGTTR
ncbi:hypothetical protein [Streptomyces sp. ALI-76-A]|uniref:MmyB family transcriptional regulator n=1 Tax=Streptomyces sp. ALI-76-A TaxID=3025736 RepID=UPI00256F0DEF|nr:hypothetical protein [Streptomyces sp. ALI-76-A]MDL5205791.1 hypothetical protein [Streptomyces sp. ALI-76-A]